MKISLNWLKQYVDINVSNQELIDLIGSRLVEVEGVIDETHKYDNIYVVRVEKAEKIPDTHLTLCQISTGSFTSAGDAAGGTPAARSEASTVGETAAAGPAENKLIQVVCGAPNVREGMLTAWIAPGAIVPASVHEDAPFVIGKRKMLKKYDSNGMLAGADELDFSEDHDKIVELDPETAKPGDLLADVFDLKDIILEIENKSLTHRPDCFGMIGFAREVAGILGQKFKDPDFLFHEAVFPEGFLIQTKTSIKHPDSILDIEIKDQNLCPRYTCALVKVTEEATKKPYLTKMDTLLAKSGMHSISKIVDITNYLMLLTGQPLHAFDFDKFLEVSNNSQPKIIIRAAKPGETLKLLDDSEIKCQANDILITSNDVPVALAGAMGGKNTAIDQNTKNILIESATFSLYNLRKTQMAHGIFSEAITRFTKGVPAGGTFNVLAETIKELGTKPLDFGDAWPSYHQPNVVKITTSEINSLLGTNYSLDLITKTLENVGFQIASVENWDDGNSATSMGDAHRGTPKMFSEGKILGDNARQDPSREAAGPTITITPPFWRTDIAIKEDIIEEIGRLLGYDNITPTLPLHATATKNPLLNFKRQVRNTLSRFGASELLTYSFVSERLLKNAGQNPKNSYQITNSISPDLQFVRQSIIPSLLEKTYLNEKLPVEKFAIYEMNQVFQKSFGENSEKVPNFKNHLGFIVAERKNHDTAFYKAKKYLNSLLEELNIEVEYLPLKEKAAEFAPFEPKRSAEVRLKDNQDILLGAVGEFKNSIKHNFKLADYLAGFEVDLDLLLEHKSQKPVRIYKTKTSEDITITTTKTYAAILDQLQQKYPTAKISPLSIYQAKGSQEKNLSFHLDFYN